jgi:hypothetical protein
MCSAQAEIAPSQFFSAKKSFSKDTLRKAKIYSRILGGITVSRKKGGNLRLFLTLVFTSASFGSRYFQGKGCRLDQDAVRVNLIEESTYAIQNS